VSIVKAVTNVLVNTDGLDPHVLTILMNVMVTTHVFMEIVVIYDQDTIVRVILDGKVRTAPLTSMSAHHTTLVSMAAPVIIQMAVLIVLAEEDGPVLTALTTSTNVN